MGRVPITVMGYRCERCSHEWVPRGDYEGEPRQCPKCKSARWDTPKKPTAMTSYDAFRDVIRETLAAVGSLTWTEIRTKAKLPQMFPNNQWVRRLETDIRLVRAKDAHGIIHWSLGTDATIEPTHPPERARKAAGRQQGLLE
jgi:DNA-directed RNA polymerase subunit RPC12/RpoP